MVEISIVVTIYNAEQTIPVLVSRLKKAASLISQNFELIFIEDRGSDNSWKLLKEEARADKKIKVARMARNFGQHNAITAGMYLSNGKYTVLMDGDLQDEPEVIPALYEKIKGSPEKEIVYVRRKNRKDPGFKIFTSRIFYKVFTAISGINTDPSVGTFRIMTSLVRESYCSFKEVNKYVGGIFSWMDFEHDFIDAEHKERAVGSSNYNIVKLLKLGQRGIVSFSNKPLSIAVYLGFISSAFSILLGIYFLLRKIFLNVSLTGYSSIIVSIYFMGGIILLVLGIIGQYVGHIYDQSKGRPEFILQEKINFEQE